MDLTLIGWGAMKLITLAQDREGPMEGFIKRVMKLRVP
jgi:hypothetical protein